MFKPRAHQKPILAYRKGKLGVSAVPGSGKTHTLSRLAANLIESDLLADDQEILIVTLVNSAVDNFTSRISGFIKEAGFLPGMGYRVRTLHGLSYDLVKERPELVGLSEQFTIIDEREANLIFQSLTNAWIKINPEFLEEWSDPEALQRKDLPAQWEISLTALVKNFVTKAKDYNVLPFEIERLYKKAGFSNTFLELAIEVYKGYQNALAIRAAVDFNDLTRLALQILETDKDLLSRLQYKWPYILEDEAQDSSLVQENILRLLAGENGNWVRVGDTNQAIYETFTTASPELLKRFLKEPGTLALDLPESGRSMRSVIKLANELIRWTERAHPEPALRDALTQPYILPVQPDDPQPNPQDDPAAINFIERKYDPDDEVVKVASSVKVRLADYPTETTAVLVPRNTRGAKVVEEFKRIGIEPVELLESTQATRTVIRKVIAALKICIQPNDRRVLGELYKLLRKDAMESAEALDIYTKTIKLIAEKSSLEEYLWPSAGHDWLQNLATAGLGKNILEELDNFRELIRKWQSASQLPIEQLILTISNDIFKSSADLALCYYLSSWLGRQASMHPEWNLNQLTEELDRVLRNERKVIGFSEEDLGFNPEAHKGKVVVSTIHKAKGLEWDKVYVMSVSNYDFPSMQSYDSYIPERWFVKDRLNLEAETLADLDYLLGKTPSRQPLGTATLKARKDYSSERLRLLYVAITRAKKGLSLTWNKGQGYTEARENQPALPFAYLAGFVRGGGLEDS